jgi:hypothetical protein
MLLRDILYNLNSHEWIDDHPHLWLYNLTFDHGTCVAGLYSNWVAYTSVNRQVIYMVGKWGEVNQQ